MLGFAPLASIPLASAPRALIAVTGVLSATGGIAFGGSASTQLRTPLSATGGLTFGGSPTPFVGQAQWMATTGGLSFHGSGFLTTEVYRSATGGIRFNGSPLLRVAGRPLVFSAIPERFEFRAEKVVFDFTALPESFIFRGIPE